MNASSNWESWGAQDLSARVQATQRTIPQIPAQIGLLVEERATGFVGEIIGIERSGGMHLVRLRDFDGALRSFPLGFGFAVDDQQVELIAAQGTNSSRGHDVAGSGGGGTSGESGSTGLRRNAAGSLIDTSSGPRRARTARASRIWVEGIHDAELIEKVWGDDLRELGIVVEPIHGADDLAQLVKDFAPAEHRRLGVLLDHLVPGSKESRIAATTMKTPGAPSNVLIVGHPYVDVWQAVKPQRLGLSQWPQVPRGRDIKTGTLQALGWAHRNQADVAQGWKKILSRVHRYTDLEPALVGRVEEMVDFVTVEDGSTP